MARRKALVGVAPGKFELVHDVKVPTVRPDMMLCRVAAIALNPADAKISDFSPAVGSVGGFDFAGEVIEVGSDVSRFGIGDRIFGLSWGQNPEDQETGAFSEYVLATEDLSCKLPSYMSYEQAATFGVAVATAGCSLYDYLGLPLPGAANDFQDSPYVLVSGGASSTGVLAVQFLKLSGLKPIATCSPQSSEMVKSLGAIETFDYHSPNCGEQINDYTNGTLMFALDCITSTETMSMCYDAIGPAGGRYLALDPVSTHVQYKRRDIYADWMVGVTVFGSPVKFAGVYGRPAMPQHRKLASHLYPMVQKLLAERALRGPKFQVRSGGLEAVADGLEDVRKGRVQAGKIVYNLA